jgi:hypothetical protein
LIARTPPYSFFLFQTQAPTTVAEEEVAFEERAADVDFEERTADADTRVSCESSLDYDITPTRAR